MVLSLFVVKTRQRIVREYDAMVTGSVVLVALTLRSQKNLRLLVVFE